MQHTLKIFCSGPQQQQLGQEINVIEYYQGFVLATVAHEQIENLAQRFPLEDITHQYVLPAGQRYLNTNIPRMSNSGNTLSHPDYHAQTEVDSGWHHYLIQFIGPIKSEWLEQLKSVGAKLQSPHNSFSYIVKADERLLATINEFSFVRWLGHLCHEDRIDPLVLERIGKSVDDIKNELPRTRLLPGMYTVTFFDSESLVAASALIPELGFHILKEDSQACLMIIKVTQDKVGKDQIVKLSAIHGVSGIRHRSLKRTSNNVAISIMNSSISTEISSLNLDGSGEVVAVCDTGLDSGEANNIHADFAGRVDALLSYPVDDYYSQFINNPASDDGGLDGQSGHGTHVAGSVLGDGSESLSVPGIAKPIRGLAYKAHLVFQAIEQHMDWKNPSFHEQYGSYLLSGIPSDIRLLFANAYERNARVHTNSWGGGRPGEYDEQCEQLDRFVWMNRDFTVLFAAGNDGTDEDGNGIINPMSVTSPGTAKNCICVGASENQRPEFNAETYGSWWPMDYPVAPIRDDPMANDPAQIVAFSSRGPTQDKRIRPDIVAPGTFILSTRSTRLAENNNAWRRFPPSKKYFFMGGTSMATPLAAGAAVLVRQFLRTEKGFFSPSAALIKAALIAGATRLPSNNQDDVVADNHQGFGRLNIDDSLVPAGPATAEFLDIVGGLNTGELWRHEVNVSSSDSPLCVVLAYSDYPGASLVNNLNLMLTDPLGQRHIGNQTAGSLVMDANNNVEKVIVLSPGKGLWNIEVVASNVPQPSQDFAMVIRANIGSTQTGTTISEQNSPNISIPDNSALGVSDTIRIGASGRIKSIKIGVDIEHTYIGDLLVNLIPPHGNEITLHKRLGGGNNNLVQSYDMLSLSELTHLKGKSVNGDWRLSIFDQARQDVGILRKWGLDMTLDNQQLIDLTSSPGTRVPDNNPQGIKDVLQVSQQGEVKALALALDISHTYIGDLIVGLSSPSGKTAVIHNRLGGVQNNLVAVFDNNSLPFLDDFIGEVVAGNWTIAVSDHAGRDVGKLNTWNLKIHLI
ncbi:MAG: subtilisin-like proprotein convertase family protein [Alphaproteobacteria bacterium]|jgi:subtilisin-like proprotein convertase family protein